MAGLLGVLVRAIRGNRVLEVGTGSGETALDAARALASGGMLITIDRDANAAARARESFADAGVERRVAVMVGDASRYLHKIAGPFDLIHQDSDPALYHTMHDRLVSLLAPGGTLVTRSTRDAGDYNETLASDPRLTTVTLDAGAGIAISVKRQDTT